MIFNELLMALIDETECGNISWNGIYLGHDLMKYETSFKIARVELMERNMFGSRHVEFFIECCSNGMITTYSKLYKPEEVVTHDHTINDVLHILSVSVKKKLADVEYFRGLMEKLHEEKFENNKHKNDFITLRLDPHIHKKTNSVYYRLRDDVIDANNGHEDEEKETLYMNDEKQFFTRKNSEFKEKFESIKLIYPRKLLKQPSSS